MSASTPPDDSKHILPLDVLEDAAEMLAHGERWDKIATAVQWDIRDLKRATRADPRFMPLVEVVKEEDRHRAEGEMLRSARENFHSEDGKERAKAIESVAKYLSSRHRDQTRLKVAEINNHTKLAVEQLRTERARAKPVETEGPKLASDGYPEPEDRPLTPEEEEHHWECERRSALRSAELVASEKGIAFLWGGCHKLGETLPDETDTPLQIFCDDTIPRQGKPRIVWAVTTPTPVLDHVNGPFLTPPGCRPPTCPSKLEEELARG